MKRRIRTGVVPYGAVRAVIANVRRSATGIPVQKEAWPSVVVHGYRRTSRRYRDLEHSYKCILKYHFVAVRRRLHSIETVRKARTILPVDINVPSEQCQKTYYQQPNGSDFSKLQSTS